MLKINNFPAWYRRPGRALLLLAMILPLTASAMSAGQRIVEEASDTSDADTMRLKLEFVMHVNYLWHFPHALNTQFLIAVQPIVGLANYDLEMREHIRVPKSLQNIVSDIYYDGTQEKNRFDDKNEGNRLHEDDRVRENELNNHFIVLETTRKVSIDIKPGRDGRSILIEFKSVAPKPAPDCTGKATNGKE